jgi:CBF/Mak21 family
LHILFRHGLNAAGRVIAFVTNHILLNTTNFTEYYSLLSVLIYTLYTACCALCISLHQALLLIFQVVKSDTPSHSRPKPGTATTTATTAKAASSSIDDASATAAAAVAAESPLVTRFYNALYAKLGDADLRQAHQPALFLNLVYRALKADTVMDRVTACSKKLLQVVEHMNFNCLHLHLHLRILVYT